MGSKRVNRRELLKSGATLAAGLTLGAAAPALGVQVQPVEVPGPDQLESFRDDMDMALSSDFRLLVYHYALEVENVFGRGHSAEMTYYQHGAAKVFAAGAFTLAGSVWQPPVKQMIENLWGRLAETTGTR